MHYYIWVPLICIMMILNSWLSVNNNAVGGKWTWIYLVYSIASVIPWVFISKDSKTLTFDSLLYDILVTVFYYAGILYFTHSISKLSNYQIIGFGLIMLGMILFKKGI